MRPKHTDLIVTMLIAALNVILTFLPVHITVLQIICALPLVFVLPGYALSEVMFRRRLFTLSERLLFSLGLSLAIDILGGLVLNILSMGLQATSWVVLLGSLTLIFSLLAFYSRRGVPMGRTRRLRLQSVIYPGIFLMLAVVVTIVSIVYAAYGASHQSYPGFTQLWIFPEASTGDSCAVRIGIQSFESTSVAYSLTMTSNGDLVEMWPSLSLVPQEQWIRLVSVPPSTSNDTSIDVRLYQARNPGTVYREVHLTFPNVREGKNGETQQCGTLQTNPTHK